jgi:hypothetical protein
MVLGAAENAMDVYTVAEDGYATKPLWRNIEQPIAT